MTRNRARALATILLLILSACFERSAPTAPERCPPVQADTLSGWIITSQYSGAAKLPCVK